MDFIDVHVFDGRLKNIFNRKRIYSSLEKKSCFENHVNTFEGRALDMLTIIMNKLDYNGSYQCENDIDASDLLIEILTHPNYNQDVHNLLQEQLEDNYTLGQCPSGRVTRLLQIWILLQH